MIRPDTPPGTEVICIDAAPGPHGFVSLARGALYTVRAIAPAVTGGHAALLEETAPCAAYLPPWGLVELGFELRRFRYCEIPRELTRLLQTAREDADAL